MKLSFQDDRDPELNSKMFHLSGRVLVRGAVAARMIVDEDLAQAAEVMPFLFKLAGELRDDLYEHHRHIQKGLQFPLIQSCFCYAFAKGAELAFPWHHSARGKVQFTYDPADALAGRAGADVTQEFADTISAGMLTMGDVFCDFQDEILTNPATGCGTGGRWTADFIACGLYWSGAIGIDYGLGHLGLR
jgi:hypothetical protein